MIRVGETKCGLYVAAYASSVLGARPPARHRNRIVRVLSALVWLVTAILELGLERINGYGYELWEAALLHESTVARDAAVTYGSDFLPPLLTAGVSLAALAWFRHAFVGDVRWSRTWHPARARRRAGRGRRREDGGLTSAFPSLFKVPVITAMANLPEGVAAVRDEPLLAPQEPRSSPILIFVVDESIAAISSLCTAAAAAIPTSSIRDRFLDPGSRVRARTA
ncbi:MAG: hypothetical protein R3F20_18440 [Planctomycetota bacterium]